MRISVLGPLEVIAGSERLDVRGAKQRALLVALALQPGRVVGTSALIDALWGDDPPPSARNSLQSYVARLRNALGADSIATHPSGYELDVPADDVDLSHFEAFLAAGHRLAEDDPRSAAESLDRALALWRGPPLADLSEPVGRPLRVSLEERRRGALRLRARTALALGDDLDAVARSSQLLEEDPLDEPTAVLHARALAASGRVRDALAALERLRTALREQLGLDPTSAVSELHHALLVGEPGVVGPGSAAPEAGAGAAAARNAPAPPRGRRSTAPLVGRADDVDRITALLEELPLVTLVGPGGVGKTRLAQAVTARWQQRAGGAPVWWVDLAPVGRDAVAARLVDVLGLAVGPEELASESVRTALSAGPGLLVLDSCEHVLDDVAKIVDELLEAGARSRVLATSRAPLAVPDERRADVAPLPFDTTDAAAVTLLRERARAAGVQLAAADLDDARRVCASLDGLPLAIELAAARLPAIGVRDLAERLVGSLSVVDAPRRGGAERHRTLARLVEWSLDLLDDAGRLLFDRLSVFAGTFELADAEAVAAGPALPRRAVGSGLAELVERSLVVGPAQLGGPCYRMLGPLRSVAEGRLAERGERSVAMQRLSSHLRALVASAEQAADTPDEARLAARLDGALDDLRALHRRARDAGDVDLIVELSAGLAGWGYWRSRVEVLAWGAAAIGSSHPRAGGALAAAAAAAWQRGAVEEAEELAGQAHRLALRASGPSAVRDAARATEALGDVALLAGHLEEASARYREALEATAHRSPSQHAAAHGNLALSAAYAGEVEAAIRHAEDAVLHADAIGAPTLRAFAFYCRGEALAEVRPDDALSDLQRARTLADASGARLVAGVATSAEVALRGRHGPPGVALERYGDAIDRWVVTGADGLLWTTLRNLVVLLVRTGADADAIALAAALEAGDVDKRATGAEARRILGALQSASGRLEPDDVDRARARGRAAAANSEALIDLARAAISSATHRFRGQGPTPTGDLTTAPGSP